MKFTFDYEEILQRRIVINADDLAEAINEMKRRIEDEEIVLYSEDFAGGKISMPIDKNFFPRLEWCGEMMKDTQDIDIVIDEW